MGHTKREETREGKSRHEITDRMKGWAIASFSLIHPHALKRCQHLLLGAAQQDKVCRRRRLSFLFLNGLYTGIKIYTNPYSHGSYSDVNKIISDSLP